MWGHVMQATVTQRESFEISIALTISQAVQQSYSE